MESTYFQMYLPLCSRFILVSFFFRAKTNEGHTGGSKETDYVGDYGGEDQGASSGGNER